MSDKVTDTQIFALFKRLDDIAEKIHSRISSLDDKMSRDIKDHETRITVIETQKTTTIALVIAGLSGIMSIATLAVAIWAIAASNKEIKELKHADILKGKDIANYGIELNKAE